MRVILFSDARARLVWRLAVRIEREVPGTRVCGLVCHRPSSSRSSHRARTAARRLGDLALRWAHACPRNPNGSSDFSDEELARRCRAAGWPLLMAGAPDSSDATEFVRRQDPDLGVCLHAVSPREDLLLIPRLGSMVGQRRQGLADDLPREVEIEAVRVPPKGSRVTLRSLTLAREPFETPTSLRLKVDLITNDLLVRSVASLAPSVEGDARPDAGCPAWTPTSASPLPGGDGDGPPPPATVGRTWRTCLYAAALAPYCIARNWYRRLRGRCPVIILFHHLAADRPHHLAMPTEAFLRSVRFLQRHYRILSMHQAMESLASGSVSVPSVVLTLDDGYRENFLTVRAVMEETGVPLTFFVNTELIEQERPFPHDLPRGQGHFLPLRWEQLEYLARNGAEIGSHTRSHFDCGSRDEAELEREIVGSKRDLEHRLGRPVPLFAFPWGQPRNMSPEATAIALANYSHVYAADGGENLPARPGPAGILRRRFQSPDPWELELGLQSVFELATSLRRALPRRQPDGGRAAHGHDGSKRLPLKA
jgi:peptidoglycan/xylan/chitin deacetylase (PgdA/CDA1 family)